MGQLTQVELHHLRELVHMEVAMYEKFRAYAEHGDKKHLRMLCDQLMDRSRQHFTALGELLHGEAEPIVGTAKTTTASRQ